MVGVDLRGRINMQSLKTMLKHFLCSGLATIPQKYYTSSDLYVIRKE